LYPTGLVPALKKDDENNRACFLLSPLIRPRSEKIRTTAGEISQKKPFNSVYTSATYRETLSR